MLTKRLMIIVVMIGCLLLSACSVTISTGETKKKGNTSSETETGTYAIGAKIFDEGNSSYYYGGYVYDSVVINAVIKENYNNAHTIPLYVAVDVKTPIKLPDSKKSIQIEELNRSKGTVKLSIIK